ncbi:hypothetical protein [Thioalkalivibrio thiocyanodenitrificans]|uniref:hypothetical protein n=1 Tax=Thioalkalivibrio thiocyanodenitrificans TaxID=243063 RepID=UPI0003A481BE|nr:hypothetical protein [Thioalkalivibrio thiocyanodenitrificans]
MSVRHDDVDIEVTPRSSPDDGETKKSAATILVELAQKKYRFGISGDGECFAVPLSGPKVVATLRGNRQSLRGQLARDYFRTAGRAAPQQALADALLVIEGMAQESAPEDLYLRVAEHGGAHWLDLGDNTGRAVRITGSGWEIVDKPPVLFKRTALNGALPEPERGADMSILWDMLNVAENDRPLVAAWLTSAFFGEIAHCVLSFMGEQGTGKTTAGKMLIRAIDPGPVPIRKPPRDAEAWVTAAAGSWVVGLDNLSDIADWLSDSICRAVTGDGDVRRKLYTDGEHAVFSFRRCVLINGIDLGTLRGDLAERMLPIHLEIIPDDKRRCDSDIWPLWDRVHPKVLGAVLDLVAGVAGVLPSVRLDSKPRMADFVRILAATDRVMGTSGLTYYMSKQGAMAADSLEGDTFVSAIAKQYPGGFSGTSAELLGSITPERPPKGWPANARSVTARLKRQAPVMRKAGWRVDHDDGVNHDKVVRWDVRPPEIARISYPQHPQDPHTYQERGRNPDPQYPQPPRYAGNAGKAGMDCRPSQDDDPGVCPRCGGEGCGYCKPF